MAGNAGDITLNVDRLELRGGAQIFNGIGFAGDAGDGAGRDGVAGPGRGGNLTVVATESILIAGQDEFGFESAITSQADGGSGRAGNVRIRTPQLNMQGGFISVGSSAESLADAGNLTLEIQRLTLQNGAEITSSTDGEGSGGNIFIGGEISETGRVTAKAERVLLNNGRITADTDNGDGANIIIGVQHLLLQNSDITNTGRRRQCPPGTHSQTGSLLPTPLLYQSRSPLVPDTAPRRPDCGQRF